MSEPTRILDSNGNPVSLSAWYWAFSKSGQCVGCGQFSTDSILHFTICGSYWLNTTFATYVLAEPPQLTAAAERGPCKVGEVNGVKYVATRSKALSKPWMLVDERGYATATNERIDGLPGTYCDPFEMAERIAELESENKRLESENQLLAGRLTKYRLEMQRLQEQLT